ncbi:MULTISPECIES: ABC transporter substrate-binding protein [unclassified Halomonas]|uniref:ABC transporter substrate-binding protein n=1 Tax=unclassified Halomonas TaxID=2609666 RepID=UPI00209FFB42|nr:MULTISPECIES: iron-siderophore ABC transporter substrate-binding protein [unclassified Halomonas]MCP1313108.1 iron-siderophore ABC transporter substrate-binding protein [Halomonas sp. 707D7]MCP1327456.1 iron-siderophore ABC transporter substrate-binding protein [Halomonas sp. 707D4]
MLLGIELPSVDRCMMSGRRTRSTVERASWFAALLLSLLVGPALADHPSPRIVTLYQGATDSAVALGVTPVGVVDSWLEPPMYPYLREALAGVEHVGLETQPNLEKIAWLAPDAIVASRFRHERIEPLLDVIAPSSVVETVYDFKTTLRRVASATHREAQAEHLLDQWQARVDDFRRQVALGLGDAWPQRVAVVRFKSDHVRIYTGGFAGSILDELGFEQPEALRTHGWGMKLTSKESIPVLNADVLFVLLEPDDVIMNNYRAWTSHPLWQRLDAAQGGRVFEVDPIAWMMGGGILAANAMLDDVYRHYALTDHGPALPDTAPSSACPTGAESDAPIDEGREAC